MYSSFTLMPLMSPPTIGKSSIPESDLFDETQKLVLRFTTEFTVDARPTEETLTAMSEQFSSKQITQLGFAICAYMANSRMANLGGCEIGDDEDYGMFTLGRKT